MQLRAPGARLRKPIRRFKQYTLLAVCASSALGFSIRHLIGRGPMWSLVVFPIVVTAALILRDKEFLDLYSRHRKGAIGEEAVGRVLANLEPAGYESLHGLDRKRGDIDHVVIGPTGVTVIETKAWRGRIYLGPKGHLMKSGFDKHHVIKRCERIAGEIHGVLAKAGVRTWVDSCVVFTASSLPKGPMKLGVIDVLTLDALPDFIEGRHHVLTPQEISAAREALLDAFN